MNGQQALRAIDRLLDRKQQPRLNDIQSTILEQAWAGDTYKSIADRLSYDLDYIKQVAARLWKLLSKLLGEDICKSNIKSVLGRYEESMALLEYLPQRVANLPDRSDGSALKLQSLETYMVSDRYQLTIAFLCSSETSLIPQSPPIDLQIQTKIESLLCQNLHDPLNSEVLIHEIYSILPVVNLGKNSINCLIINCYSQS
jgi:hypothetical protein